MRELDEFNVSKPVYSGSEDDDSMVIEGNVVGRGVVGGVPRIERLAY